METMNVEQYSVVYVSPDLLDPSPQQPEKRTSWDASMKKLKLSIQDIGLQYPPLVLPKADGRFEVIDGHRRLECMKGLKYPKVPVLPTQGKPSELYAGVSGNVAKMKASQWIEVFLKGGLVPSGPNKTCIARLSETMGREFLERLAKKGWSPQIWNVSRRVLKYCDLPETAQSAVLTWLLAIGTQAVSTWMQAENAPEKLREALEEGREPVS